jgi:hypothetical protein
MRHLPEMGVASHLAVKEPFAIDGLRWRLVAATIDLFAGVVNGRGMAGEEYYRGGGSTKSPGVLFAIGREFKEAESSHEK